MTKVPFSLEQAFQQSRTLATGTIEPLVASWLGDETMKSASEHSEALWNILFGQLKFARTAKAGARFSDEECERWANLLRWMTDTLQNMRPPFDKRLLECIFTFSAEQECAGDFWALTPAEIGQNKALMSHLAEMIDDSSVSVRIFGNFNQSTQDKEHYEESEKTQNWKELDRILRYSDEPADIFLSEIVRALHRYDSAALVERTNAVSRTALAKGILSSLSHNAALRLATETTNSRIEFAALMSIAHRHTPLPEDAFNSAVAFLVRAAGSDTNWDSWMKVFCRYPEQTAHLHHPLGLALARLPVDRAISYIDAIEPRASSLRGRDDVANCMRAFRTGASPEHQKSVWKRAHERWKADRFGQSEIHPHLMEEGFSRLDYAVVGYFVQNFTTAELEKLLEDFNRSALRIEHTWFLSLFECRSEYFRVLSELQPVAHACAILCEEMDWLMTDRRYGFDPNNRTKYFVLRFPDSRIVAEAKRKVGEE